MLKNETANSIVFAKKAAPSLAKGHYQVEVKQSSSIPDCRIADAGISILTAGDPFTLQKEEVYSVYPPGNAVGSFELTVAQAVFKRRTLPWERHIVGGRASENRKDIPWLTLLLFDENEQAVFKKMTVREAFTKTAGIYCPQPEAEEITDEECRVLEVEAALFHDVCPVEEDLALMAHVKGVSLDDKVTDPAVLDSWFSCLLANRFTAGAGKDGLKFTAYVVSLEYFGAYLDLTQEERYSLSEAAVRIPVLYSWDFYLLSEDYDFSSVFKKLDADCLISDASKKLLKEQDNELLKMGYILLNHELREGSRTVSWYHGPLTPCLIQEEARKPQCFADALLKYDPETGMLDTSYSAAWQLGRMLALKAKAFAGTMEKWRFENKQKAVKYRSERLLNDKIEVEKELAIEQMLTEFLRIQGDFD